MAQKQRIHSINRGLLRHFAVACVLITDGWVFPYNLLANTVVHIWQLQSFFHPRAFWGSQQLRRAHAQMLARDGPSLVYTNAAFFGASLASFLTLGAIAQRGLR